jgi:hypothetical protein
MGQFGSIAVDPQSGNVFVAVEADSGSPAEAKPGIYLSADKGATWSAIYSDGAFGTQFDALLIDPAQPDVLYATERSASLIKLTKPSSKTNGIVSFRWHDDGTVGGPPIGDGKIGFRQMAPLIAEYANLTVHRVNRYDGMTP